MVKVALLIKVAKQLSTPSLAYEKIAEGIQTLGYRITVPCLQEVLEFSIFLQPHFSNLKTLFPAHKDALDSFLLSKNIHEILEVKNDFDLTFDSSFKKHSPGFIFSIGERKLKNCLEKSKDCLEESIYIGEMISFIWLVNALIDSVPNLSLILKDYDLLEILNNFFNLAPFILEDEPDFILQNKTDLLADGAEAWSRSFSKVLNRSAQTVGAKTLEVDELFQRIQKIVELLQKNESVQTHPKPSRYLVVKEYQSTHELISDQSGIRLTERKRLKSFFGGLRDSEKEKLKKALDEVLEVGHTHKNFYEAVLVALALSTGRTIEAVLSFSIDISKSFTKLNQVTHSLPNEYLSFELVSGYEAQFIEVSWRRNFKKLRLKLVLPSLLQKPLKNEFRLPEAKIIVDCLPYSVESWPERTYSWLSDFVDGTHTQLQTKIKDTLSREIYQYSSSSSLLNYLVTPMGEVWRKRESLSHYVSPLNQKSIEVYVKACKSIFGKYGNTPKHIFSINEEMEPTVDHEKISAFFLTKVNEASRSKNIIKYHNAIAHYILMLLVVATGHRASKTPFFFPWDICHEENLAFLCDKVVVGSEARFVPITAWLSELVVNYKLHLVKLIDHLKIMNPDLASLIRQQSLGLGKYTIKNTDNNSPVFGTFFIIDGKLNAKVISTKDIEKYYSEVSNTTIRAFRQSVANYLWNHGFSGMQIEGFLGHNAEYHVFGASSAWSINGWGEVVRPAIVEYLKFGGWMPIKISFPSEENDKQRLRVSSEMLPLITSSTNGYEGRARSGKNALAFAKKIVKANLPEDWFNGEKASISEKDVQTLKDIVRQKLAHDSAAQEKVSFALAEEINRLRNRIQNVSITANSINLARVDAGPVDIGASRNLAIAKAIRHWWISEIGHFSRSNENNAIERLTQIGLNLILFDAVLDIDVWRSLMEAIAKHEVRSLGDCLVVHVTVQKLTKIYDKTVILSPITQALLQGYEKVSSKYLPEDAFFKELEKSVQQKIRRAPSASTENKYSLNDFFYVFRSWWLIRLPGTLYAIAIGDFSGPAADVKSEQALFGFAIDSESIIHPKPVGVLQSRIIPFENINNNSNTPKLAYKKINEMLSIAEGRFEKMESTSRKQRIKLSRLLDESIPSELKWLSEERMIVGVFIDFIKYLIEEGGQRKERLAFSSIRTYISLLQQLLDVFWQDDLFNLESRDFENRYDKFYSSHEGLVTRTDGRIQLFHQFLRETIEAPYCLTIANTVRIPSQCRASLIDVNRFESAWNMINQFDVDNVSKHHARTYLSLGYCFGLRRREAYGLEAEHILLDNSFDIVVKKNAYRDLKSSTSKRIIPNILLSTKQKKHLSEIANSLRLSGNSTDYVFKNTETPNQLFSTSRIDAVVRTVLRKATENYDIVPHSMRHTVATRLTHFAIKSPRQIPISEKYEASLGKFDENKFFDIFSSGFNAWPYWIDRVALMLGHSDTDTLLNTYWHSSSVRMAEFCWHDSNIIAHFNQDQLAGMLGLDRTSVTRMKQRLNKKLESDQPLSNETLIGHYIRISKIKSFGNLEFKLELELEGNLDDLTLDSHKFGKGVIHWEIYDSLLVQRQLRNTPLNNLYPVAELAGIDKDKLDIFLNAYKKVAESTGFYDFEPIYSELLLDKPKYTDGVVKGRNERRRGLAIAQRLVQVSEQFSQSLNKFATLWIEMVNPEDPWFVSRTSDELKLILEMLLALGVSDEQLEFSSCCDFNLQSLNGIIRHDQLKEIEVRSSRFSRGNKKARIPELGVRIKQQKNAKIGDGRDTQRLIMLLVSCNLHLGCPSNAG